jgi:hypothetical protein
MRFAMLSSLRPHRLRAPPAHRLRAAHSSHRTEAMTSPFGYWSILVNTLAVAAKKASVASSVPIRLGPIALRGRGGNHEPTRRLLTNIDQYSECGVRRGFDVTNDGCEPQPESGRARTGASRTARAAPGRRQARRHPDKASRATRLSPSPPIRAQPEFGRGRRSAARSASTAGGVGSSKRASNGQCATARRLIGCAQHGEARR